MRNLATRSRAFFYLILSGCILGGAGCRTESASTPPVAAPAPPSSAGAAPNLNTEFTAPDVDAAKWRDRFEREGREIYDHRQAILAALELKPGEVIADVGAGSGLFTLLFAEAVGPKGKVYANDISKDFLRLIDQRAQAAGLRNVVTVQGTDRSTELAPNSVDRVFVCDTYHHFEHPQPMLASIRQALRPKGELIIIDFKKIPGQSREWIMNHVRATQAEATAEIEAADFHQTAELDLLQDNWFARFKKSAP